MLLPSTNIIFLICLFISTAQAEPKINPSYQLQSLDNHQPIMKDPHLSPHRGHKVKKGQSTRVENTFDRAGNFIEDDYERDYVGKYSESYNTNPVTGNHSSSYYFLDHATPTAVVNSASKIPRFTRIFGGFLKNSKTKLEGRVYSTFNNHFCQFKEDLCSTVDVGFAYELPHTPYTEELNRGGRALKIEADHAAVFETVEGLFNKVNINGKACVLRLICELAESKGLPYNGLLGRTFETLFLIDYGMSSTERLYEYISARMYGETEGNCAQAYPQCPFSVFNMMETNEEED